MGLPYRNTAVKTGFGHFGKNLFAVRFRPRHWYMVMQLLLLTTDIPRLSLHEAMRLLGYKDARSARRWCASHNVVLLRDAGTKSSYVIKSEFIAARLVSIEIYLKKRYGTQHYKQALSAYCAGDITAINGITEATKKSFRVQTKAVIAGKSAANFQARLAKIISGE